MWRWSQKIKPNCPECVHAYFRSFMQRTKGIGILIVLLISKQIYHFDHLTSVFKCVNAFHFDCDSEYIYNFGFGSFRSVLMNRFAVYRFFCCLKFICIGCFRDIFIDIAQILFNWFQLDVTMSTIFWLATKYKICWAGAHATCCIRGMEYGNDVTLFFGAYLLDC